MSNRKITFIGVPLDLGAGRRGVDMGPSAIRSAGIHGTVRSLGYDVEDAGDVEVQIQETQDAGDPRLKFLKEIRTTCEALRDRVTAVLQKGRIPVVLGGDHSIAMGTISGVSRFHREKGGSKEQQRESDEPAAPQAIWDVPGDIGRRYAAVSGDRNPIHMHPLSAKLFGMKTNIAHGMWTKARCLAAIESELPESYTVEVRFKLPIFLPAKVAFGVDASAAEGGTRHFHVRDAKQGKPHVEGQITGG